MAALFSIESEFSYQITRKIFEGGLGIVYEAEQHGARTFVKRIAIKLGGGLVISSDNPHYHATHQELTRSELEFLRIIGRVVWVGGRI